MRFRHSVSSLLLAVCIQATAQAAYLVFPEGDKNLQSDVKAAFDAYKLGEYPKAFKLFSAQAAKGDKNAMFAIGKMYQEGTGVDANPNLAEEYYRKAADLGQETAQYNLAQLLLSDPKRVPEGIKWLKDSAGAGSGKSMLVLGQLYANGQGVTQDFAAAKGWFDKAAEKGEADAYLLLGQLSELGKGATKDMKKALELYENAAKRDSLQAILKLAELYANGAEGVEKDMVKAKEWLETGVDKEKEGTTATLNLGLLYEAVEKKPAQAFKYYKMAADKNDPTAMVKVASMYFTGEGAEKNVKTAFDWFKKAAEAGNPAGMFFISNAYEKGEGTTANAKDAKQWLISSAVGGYAPAMRQLGLNYRDGKGLFKDILAATTWLQKALSAGDGQSAMILSEMLEKGDEVTRDLKASNALLSRVAEAGSVEAVTKLASNSAEGVGTQKDLIRAYALLLAAGDYEPAKKKIEELAKKMSKGQIAEAAKELERMKAKPATDSPPAAPAKPQ